MLGPVSFATMPEDCRPDWVIAGPETGPKARPCADAWIEGLAAESRCFFDKREGGKWREFPGAAGAAGEPPNVQQATLNGQRATGKGGRTVVTGLTGLTGRMGAMKRYTCPVCKTPLELIDFCADFSGYKVEVTDLYRCPKDGWQGFVEWKDGVLVPSTGVVASG
jgi:hypothetical protein